MEQKKNYKILTIPNILSFLRLIFVAVFILLYRNDNTFTENIPAIIVLALSGLTDFLDGRIARRFNVISELGKILDPVADKVTEAVIAICLLEKYRIMFILLGTFIIKELFMCICGVIVIKKTGTNNGAKWYGKVSTFTFYLTVLALLLIPGIPKMAANIIISICIVLMAFALIMYMRLYYNILSTYSREKQMESDFAKKG